MKALRLASVLLAWGAACGGEAAHPPGWSAPVAIDEGGAPGELRLDGDATGNAFAVWSRRGAGTVTTARFDGVTRTWAAPSDLVVPDGGPASQLDLSVGPAGNVAAVWRQGSAGLASVWSSWRGTDTGTWREPVLVERDDTGDAAEPCVAVLPAGGAVAVWHQWDGLRESLWSNQLGDTPTRWTGRALLETTDSADAVEPDVAADALGNAVAVWTQDDGVSVTVWTARRAGANAWGAPFMLSESGLSLSDVRPTPRVVLDGAGNGLALWSLSTGRDSGLWASRYDTRTDAWSASAAIETADRFGVSTDATLAVDREGDAFALWRRHDEGGTSLWANTFSAATGTWRGATRLDEETGPPMVDAAGARRAIAVWQDAVDGSIRARRFDPESGSWTASAPLDRAGRATGPRISVDPAGNAVAIFARVLPGGFEGGVWSVHAPP